MRRWGEDYTASEEFKSVRAHVLDVVHRRGELGLSPQEAERILKAEHRPGMGYGYGKIHLGSTSGALSTLHTKREIACLAEKVDNFGVYLDFEHVGDRAVKSPAPEKKSHTLSRTFDVTVRAVNAEGVQHDSTHHFDTYREFNQWVPDVLERAEQNDNIATIEIRAIEQHIKQSTWVLGDPEMLT